MFLPTVKSEPIDDAHIEQIIEPTNDDDEIVASYDVVMTSHPKYNHFTVAGLSNVLNRVKQYDVSIRTDLKEVKFTSKLHDSLAVCYTKETNLNLDRKTYAVKFSRETGNAYFVPITSFHSISFLDEANKSSKAVDLQNSLYEDCFKMPHPSRNKHDQLCIEMKNYLYKPLKRVQQPDQVKKLFADLYSFTQKKALHLTESTKTDVNPSENDTVDLISCPHWYLSRVNLYDITRIEVVDLKIEALLRKGQFLTFYEIQSLLNVDLTKLLSVLQNICHLIRGNWVIKSHNLYRFNPFHDSEAKQNHYKDLIAAREFVLWIVAENRNVKFQHIHPKFKKSPDHEEILYRLTKRNGQNGIIEFVVPEDRKFLLEYSNLAQKHIQKTITMLSKHQNYLDT